MLLRKIPASRINPAPYNPRKDLQPGDPEYEKLAKSIDQFGCVEPLVWNKRSGNLVGGHQRFKVLQARGDTHVQVSVVDLPPDQEKALNLALNKISGDWDPRKLAELLEELTQVPEFDLGLTGFEVTEAQDLIDEVLRPLDENRVEDFDVEAELAAQRPLVTKPGEMLELGDHRLLCGDCTKVEDVQKVMSGYPRKAVLFATDPPYLVGYDGLNHPSKSTDKKKQKNKNKDWSDSYGVTWDDADANPELYEKFIGVAIAEAVFPGAAWYCWHASRRQAMVEAAWQKHGAFVHQQILWVKDRPILTRSWYLWQHEPCFFGWVKPNKPPRTSDDFLPTVWQIPTVAVGAKTEHPTSKPVELFAIPMRQHTKRREVCYEPFAGSGSQLIAAESLGRRCFAIEISPRYCDVVVRRWIAWVGEAKAPSELLKRYRIKKEGR
ncbi:MAG: DNA modification methylase [Phycisphaeraceae bacterium]|nr:DNA modification methylase [Phycisphaeraceae bacterium]